MRLNRDFPEPQDDYYCKYCGDMGCKWCNRDRKPTDPLPPGDRFIFVTELERETAHALHSSK